MPITVTFIDARGTETHATTVDDDIIDIISTSTDTPEFTAWMTGWWYGATHAGNVHAVRFTGEYRYRYVWCELHRGTWGGPDITYGDGEEWR